MNYKERLLFELEELIIRIDRLTNWLKTQDETLNTDLEEEQLHVMSLYKVILKQRIANMMNEGKHE